MHDDDHVPRVLAQGVPRLAVYGIRPLVGVAAVEIDDSGFFQFIEDGELAIVVADGVPDPMGWNIIDEIVAIRTKTPGRWWRATGATPVFGHGKNADLIDYKATLGESIRLYETPLSWLRGGGDGLVILNWTLDPRDHFQGLRIECETSALAMQLRKRAADAAVAGLDLTVRRVRYAA
jgi:hypothetical protein